jgi:putative SOS response-associated peptidase YedK
MCGRFLWASSGEAIADYLQVPALRTLRPRYNVAPSVAVDKAGVRQLGYLRWGLVPRWANDPKKAPINARAETAADKPFAFAALWDVWREPSGRMLPTFCILTTTANELVRPVHGRMPVIVPERHLDLWLSRDVQEPADLAPVLRPYPADAMRAFPVGPAANHPRNDGPERVAPPT